MSLTFFLGRTTAEAIFIMLVGRMLKLLVEAPLRHLYRVAASMSQCEAEGA
jgi:hypothetical protein